MASLLALVSLNPAPTPWWTRPPWVRITRPDDAILIGIWLLVGLAALAGRMGRVRASSPPETPQRASDGPNSGAGATGD